MYGQLGAAILALGFTATACDAPETGPTGNEAGGGGTGGGTETDDPYPLCDGPDSDCSGPPQTCAALPVCEGVDRDPTSGCFQCVTFGDSSLMPDAGKCLSQYQTCFGTVGDCSDGTPECCALLDCIDTCDFDLDGAIAAGDELDCICTNDGVDCVMEPPDSMTCLGLHGAGFDAINAYQDCVYGTCSGC